MRYATEADFKYATEETELRREAKGLDLLQAYPFTFAFLSILVFLGAIVKMAYLSFDPNVRYWIGWWPTWIAFLPLGFIFSAYLIHRIKGQPSKFASLVGLLGPSIMLFVGGYKMSISSLTLSTAFGSTDCITNPEMYKLGQDYRAAVAFKSACNASAGSTIEDCVGYEAAELKNPGWQYLSHLQKTTGCGGWCEASKTLWAYPGGVQDPCSSVASEALGTEVLYPSMQVAIYSIAVLFLTTVGIAVLGPKAENMGLNW